MVSSGFGFGRLRHRGMIPSACEGTLWPVRRYVGVPIDGHVLGERSMPLTTILIIILILALIGVLPTWGHSRSWGYGPSGVVGVILIILLIMALTGRV
jgi:hypothetical protein